MRTDRIRPTSIRALLLAAVGFVLLGCSSTGPSADEVMARITYRQFTDEGDSELELRSESHTDRVEFYSRARGSAETKILRDDAFGDLLKAFDSEGYASIARPGPGPKSASGGVRKVIEVERDGAVSHVATGSNTARDTVNVMARLTINFFAAYNSVKGYQTIQNDSGNGVFLGPND